jgi:hypothetical protein
MTPVESARGTGAGTSRRLRERLIRYGRIVGGTCLTAVGVLLLILPGPGIPLLLAGLLLLEREIEWARPLRLEIMRRLRSIGSAARRIVTCALRRGTSPGGSRVKARPPHAPPRPPPPQEPLVSWRHWRRALAISIEAGLTKAERRELLARLARVRRGDEPPRASPRLRLVRGGERRTAAPPLPGARPGSKDAA